MKKIKKDTGLAALGALALMYLETGVDLFGYVPPADHGRSLWNQHRAALMKSYLAERECTPGERPWSFWKFDVPPGTTRRFYPGTQLAGKKGGVYPDRAACNITSTVIPWPQPVEFWCFTYDPADPPYIEDDIGLLARLGMPLTLMEKNIIKSREKKGEGEKRP